MEFYLNKEDIITQIFMVMKVHCKIWNKACHNLK